MYKTAKVTFKSITDDKQQSAMRVGHILDMLLMNGQILEYILEAAPPYLVATVTTADDDSLDPQYFNAYIRQELSDFEMQIEIIGDDPLATDSCHCMKHCYMILYADPECSSSPVICGDCHKEIPLIRLPYLYREEEHYSILNWKKLYSAVDRLWMDSLSDRFAKRQLTDPDSELNQRGLAICRELESQTSIPVYLFLRAPLGGWYDFKKNNQSLEHCPKCRGKFKFLKDAPVDKVCVGCRLAFLTVPDDIDR